MRDVGDSLLKCFTPQRMIQIRDYEYRMCLKGRKTSNYDRFACDLFSLEMLILVIKKHLYGKVF